MVKTNGDGEMGCDVQSESNSERGGGQRIRAGRKVDQTKDVQLQIQEQSILILKDLEEK